MITTGFRNFPPGSASSALEDKLCQEFTT
jgi:hypothetical protein